MLVWYPLLKLLVCAALLALAALPIYRHIEHYKKVRQEALRNWTPMPEGMTYWPTRKRAYLPLLLVLVVFLATPFKLQNVQSSERTIVTYDEPPAPPPIIEREARQKYTPPDNRALIDDLLKEEAQK